MDRYDCSRMTHSHELAGLLRGISIASPTALNRFVAPSMDLPPYPEENSRSLMNEHLFFEARDVYDDSRSGENSGTLT